MDKVIDFDRKNPPKTQSSLEIHIIHIMPSNEPL